MVHKPAQPPIPPLMKHERRLRWCLRAGITKTIAALDTLQQDSAALEQQIQGCVTFIIKTQTKLRALDAKMQADLTDAAF